jgi:chromosome segregation ATPase
VDFTETSNIIPLAGAIITIGTAILTIQKVTRNVNKSKAEHAEEIRKSVQDQITLEKIKLESRIEVLEKDLKNLEDNVGKDLEHVKEAYRSEMKALGDKIEDLRSQIQQQHSQLLQFLSNLLNG